MRHALCIKQGCPWRNGFEENLNNRVRDELLNVEMFGSLLEAQVLAEDWRQRYNHKYPHSGSGWQTPLGGQDSMRVLRNDFLCFM